jgi:D-alanine transfer protein
MLAGNLALNFSRRAGDNFYCCTGSPRPEKVEMIPAKGRLLPELENITGITIPHLFPALVAILILGGFLAGGSLYARQVEQKNVNILAPARPKQAVFGSALQEAAFRQPDLLLVYGSSEVYMEEDENSASQFFRSYPTDFTVFEVATAGVTSLELAENLAALGPEIKGKKIVISFTPDMFTSQQVRQSAYAGDFSRLHANQLIFSPTLSYALKQRIARRMLDYPDTLATDSLLEFAVKALARQSRLSSCMYYLSLPAGQLQTQVIRLQDHWAVLDWLHSHPAALQPAERRPAAIDWKAEMEQAHNLQVELTSSNAYGIDETLWKTKYQAALARNIVPSSLNNYFMHEVANSKEWEDFDILLSVLKETGARPLILSRPLNGAMWNAMGVSASARQFFYDSLQKAVQPYGFPLVDFSDQDTNRFFSIDLSSHTSRLGWVYIDQALDNFYHSRN